MPTIPRSEVPADALTALFVNPPPAFVLWFRPSTGRTPWEAVARCETEQEAVNAIGIGGRRHGKWIVLPDGKDP